MTQTTKKSKFIFLGFNAFGAKHYVKQRRIPGGKKLVKTTLLIFPFRQILQTEGQAAIIRERQPAITTYATITEAFAHGAGDVFYTKDSRFICLSRHDDKEDQMTAAGFARLTYQKVNALAQQESKKIKLVPVTDDRNDTTQIDNVTISQPKNARTWKPTDTSEHGNYTDGFYDEFPDALNQSL